MMTDDDVEGEHLTGTFIRSTAGAYCVRLDDEHRDRWIPRSVVTDVTENLQMGDDIDIFVKQWWAIEEGLA